jgi:hypothetical protein
MNHNREYFPDILYISEKQVKFINQNHEIAFENSAQGAFLFFLMFSNAIHLNWTASFSNKGRAKQECARTSTLLITTYYTSFSILLSPQRFIVFRGSLGFRLGCWVGSRARVG